MAELLKDHDKWVVQYHEHDSLLENRPEEELTEEERKAAWEEYELEKKGLLFRHNNTFAPSERPFSFTQQSNEGLDL